MSTPKVLLIGWDSADWRVITPLLDAGHLPHLRSLLDRGVTGNLAAIPSFQVWTSLATGKRADKQRKSKAVWDMLAQEGRKSIVVGWRATHPAGPLSDGVMVSSHFHRPPADNLDKPWPLAPGTVYPGRLAPQLAELRVPEVSDDQIRSFVPTAADIDKSKDRRLAALARTIAGCANVHAAAAHLMQNEPWDFTAVFFDALEHFDRGFMRYHPPRQSHISEEDFALYRDVIESAYRYYDTMLGDLIALAGPETTIVFVSDRGFHPAHLWLRGFPPEQVEVARPHCGVFVLSGPGIKHGERIDGSTEFDICPTLLTLFGLPVGADMGGQPLLAAWEEPPAVSFVDSWDPISEPAHLPDPHLGLEPLQALKSLEHEREEAAEFHLQLGRQHLSRKDTRAAEMAFLQVLRKDPDSAAACLGLAHVRLAENRDSEAAGYALNAIALVYHQPQAHFALGLALQRLGSTTRAAEAFGMATYQDPSLIAAHSRRFECCEGVAQPPALQNRASGVSAFARIQALRRAEDARERMVHAGSVADSAAAWPILDSSCPSTARPEADFVTIVTGLPHSGTSLILQMLAAGGLPTHPNHLRLPGGENSWELPGSPEDFPFPLARGKALVLAPAALLSLPAGETYRVIFMERPLDEVLASRGMMPRRHGRAGSSLSLEDLKSVYQQHLAAVHRALNRAGVPVLRVKHWRAISNPRDTARKLAHFLPLSLDCEAMARTIVPALHRQRYE